MAAIYVWREPLRQLWALLQDQTAVSSMLRQYGWWGPLALAVAQFFQVLIAFIPGHVFVIAGGYVYGFWLGICLNILLTVGFSQLAFALARRWGRPFIHRLARPEQIERWQGLGREQGFAFFTLSFIFPIFPTDIMNFVAGLTAISGWDFLAASIIGRFPGLVLLTLVGSHGLQLSPVMWAVLMLCLAALVVGGRLVLSRYDSAA
ncbi:MAG: VTT domain-containing protein [Chloroflexota bacterium]